MTLIQEGTKLIFILVEKLWITQLMLYKTLPVRLDRWPFQPSMTEDSAIRIDLHSASAGTVL